MVARRKARAALSEAARDNPYATLSRTELDAALDEVEAQLASLPDEAVEQRAALEKTKRQIYDGYLWLMVAEGVADWSGGKPKGSNPPIEITPGPPISDYIHEGRR